MIVYVLGGRYDGKQLHLPNGAQYWHVPWMPPLDFVASGDPGTWNVASNVKVISYPIRKLRTGTIVAVCPGYPH